MLESSTSYSLYSGIVGVELETAILTYTNPKSGGVALSVLLKVSWFVARPGNPKPFAQHFPLVRVSSRAPGECQVGQKSTVPDRNTQSQQASAQGFHVRRSLVWGTRLKSQVSVRVRRFRALK